MGCDGGTIPKRHELVKGPRKVEKVDKVAELVARWFYCALSQEKLRRPIVACELGRLYNKDAIIEFLLDKSPDKTPMESASHIKSIKNVTELNLVDNPAWSGDKESIKGDKYDDLQSARFICPVVGLEMNGRHRFCFLRNCGCVFSERALKEIKSEVCHKCGVPFQEEDVIILNGNKEDLEVLKKRMEDRRLKSKLEKMLLVPQKLRMGRILSIPVLGKRDRLSSPKVQKMEIHLSQQKSIKLLLLLRRDPLQTARRSLRRTNLFLQHTAQQNVQRRSVPIGLLTQLTISETMSSLIGTSTAAFLPQGFFCTTLILSS
ncbi:replication termination factor 2 isoform X2 [Pipra filicauda]|uniref:Replication termination factor 2 n=1 Tax=Pipra filicauda TaxID=649802 RepID=A0A6J2FTC0_9PASS|nr:replication termination factor 2 isoform X2 [Pipra filicauda]